MLCRSRLTGCGVAGVRFSEHVRETHKNMPGRIANEMGLTPAALDVALFFFVEVTAKQKL